MCSEKLKINEWSPTMEVVKWKYVSLVAGEQCVMMDGDRYDTNAACRQLGFTTHRAIPTWGAYFGKDRADGPIFWSQFECEKSRNVPQLLNCTRSGPDHQCLHSQDAGVICYGIKCCDVVML